MRLADGKLLGSNTDGPGFARAIRSEFSVDLRDLRVLLLGAGGGAGAGPPPAPWPWEFMATRGHFGSMAGLLAGDAMFEVTQSVAEGLDSLAHRALLV